MTLSDDEEGAVASDGSDDDDFALSTAAGEPSRRAVASALLAAKERRKAKKDWGSGSGGEAEAADGGIVADLIADVDGAHGHAGATAAALATGGGGLAGRQLSLDAKLRARAAELAPVEEPDLDGYEEEEGEDGAPVLKEVRLKKKARETAAAREAQSSAAEAGAAAGAGGHGAASKGKKAARSGTGVESASAPDVAVGASPAKPTTFKELGLSLPLLKAIQELGFAAPTPIQVRTSTHNRPGPGIAPRRGQWRPRAGSIPGCGVAFARHTRCPSRSLLAACLYTPVSHPPGLPPHPPLAACPYAFPSPLSPQASVIPAALRGIDICGSAVTGSGKPPLPAPIARGRRLTARQIKLAKRKLDRSSVKKRLTERYVT